MQPETAIENLGTIFAYDADGYEICVGDYVSHNRKLYRVQKLKWDVSGDGLYRETVYLELIHVKSTRIKIVEDKDVELLN